MMLLKLLLNSALILIGATASFTDEKLEKDTNSATIEYHLPDYIIPNHYDIDIILSHKSHELEVESFFGTCVAYIKINRPTHNISLHAQKPQIEVAHAILNILNNTEKFYKENYTYNNESHILVFHFAEEIPSGNYSFTMKFDGCLNDDGENFFKTSYESDRGSKT